MKVGSHPASWRVRPLGELVRPTRPRHAPRDYPDVPFVGMENVEAHSMRLLGTVPSGEMRSAGVHFQPWDVLYGRLRPYLNKVCRPSFEGLCSAEFIVFPPSDELDSAFLQYRLNASDFVAFASHLNEGDRPRVDFDQIAKFPISYPSVPEQKHIVAEIEKQFTRLDAGVAALDRLQAHLRRYRAALLNSGCRGRLLPNGTSDVGSGELPAGWRWALMSELAAGGESASIFAGPFGTLFKAKDFRPAGVPIIFLRHVAPGRYLTRKPGFMDEAVWHRMFRPYSVHGGELLVTKLGEPPGACAIYPHGIGPAMVTPDVIAMRVESSVADPRYLMHYLNSDDSRRVAFGLAFGTTRLRLTLSLFRNLGVPLPPLVEQQRIVAELDRHLSLADGIQQAAEHSVRRAALVRTAILRAAFEGSLAAPEQPVRAPAA